MLEKYKSFCTISLEAQVNLIINSVLKKICFYLLMLEKNQGSPSKSLSGSKNYHALNKSSASKSHKAFFKDDSIAVRTGIWIMINNSAIANLK